MELVVPVLLLLLGNFHKSFAADVVAKTAAETKQVLQSSKTGQMIRECSCEEEGVCVQQIQSEIRECFGTCWEQDQLVNQLSKNPEQLKQCFKNREHLINEFIDCVKSSGETCVNSKAGPQIPYVDMDRLIGAGEQRLKAQANAFLRTMGGKSQELAAVDIGTCMKNCFVQKNGRGSCFDRTGCNPKLEEDMAGPVIKRCARQIGWKKEAAEMCDCALNAGVQSVKPYCQILHGSQKSHSDNIPLRT